MPRGVGPTRFDGARGHVFTTADGLAANNAWDVEVDARGWVWAVTTEDNAPRTCLSIDRAGVPYHPLFNRVTWRAGCP